MTCRLLRACRREVVDRTPVWFMRQAGRYLPEYRALRERHSLLDICGDAELSARVTLQPLQRFELDAAIIFADILLPIVSMGVELDFVPGTGPVIRNPIRSAADVRALVPLEPEAALAATLGAIREVRTSLSPEIAVIGFAGAPFTVAAYMVEGGPSRSFSLIKTLMAKEPETFSALMEKLADASSVWLQAQLQAGADAVQLFDTWAGCLDASTYRSRVGPYSARILADVADGGTPSIHFAVSAPHLVEALRTAGGDVLGVDWRLPLDEAWNRLGHDRGIQGNLDPAALLAPEDRMRSAVRAVMRGAGGRRGHVFNLGHGILPGTPIENVHALVEEVHRW